MTRSSKKASPPKSAAKPKRPKDVNQLAHFLVKATTESPETESPERKPTSVEISRVMAEMGRRGGKVGGKKRAAWLTKERRVEIALKAARSRWDKKR